MFAARITAPKKFEIEDIAIPEINDGQCLIKLEKGGLAVIYVMVMGLFFLKSIIL